MGGGITGGCFSYLFVAVFSTLGTHYSCNPIFFFLLKREEMVNRSKSRSMNMEKGVLGGFRESLELKAGGNADLQGEVDFGPRL